MSIVWLCRYAAQGRVGNSVPLAVVPRARAPIRRGLLRCALQKSADICLAHAYEADQRYADPEDLAIIKEAAKRRGISEAEIIRQGIHLAAMANRVWDEPLFSRTFEGSGRTARQG